MKYIVLMTLLIATGCASKKIQNTDTNSASKTVASVASTITPKDIVDPIAKMPNPSKLTCNKGKETRTLEVVLNGKGCSLKYTKFGKIKTAASSESSLKHCETTKIKILTKLEKSGYQCI